MARLSHKSRPNPSLIPNPSAFSANNPYQYPPPSSPPSTGFKDPITAATTTSPYSVPHPPPPSPGRAFSLSRLSLNIYRLLRNHPGFSQGEENCRARQGLYRLVQRIIDTVTDAVNEDPLLLTKMGNRSKDGGEEVAKQLGLGQLRFEEHVLFPRPVNGNEKQYFESGKSPTKIRAVMKDARAGKSKVLAEIDLNALGNTKSVPLEGGLSLKCVSKKVESEKSPHKAPLAAAAPTATRARKAAATKLAIHSEPMQDPVIHTRPVSVEAALMNDEAPAMPRVIQGTRSETRTTGYEPRNSRALENTGAYASQSKREAELLEEDENFSLMSIPQKRVLQEVLIPVHADKLMAPQVAVKSKAITRAKRATTTVSGTLITHKKARIDSDDPAEAGVENEGLAKFKERRRRCIDTELQLPSETMAEATAFEFRPTARVSLDVGKNIVTATKEAIRPTISPRRVSKIKDKKPVNYDCNASDRTLETITLDIGSPAFSEPTILRRSARSTKGPRIKDGVSKKSNAG